MNNLTNNELMSIKRKELFLDKERKDIDKQYTWDLEVIYSSNKDLDSDYDKVKELNKTLFNFGYKI